MTSPTPGPSALLSRDHLAALLRALRDDGYRLIGPSVRDGAIVHSEIAGIEDLPAGWTEVQDAGRYCLERREDAALFGYAVGPHSWKPQFFVPELKLMTLQRRDGSFVATPARDPAPRLALIGARSCDLHAIAVQDRTFMHGTFVDPDYTRRRADVFVLAVNCGQAGGSCFCVSMQTGPRATAGFDLALTELLDPHRFVVEAGSDRGAGYLTRLGVPAAGDAERQSADEVVERTAGSMKRHVDTSGIKELLYRNQEHPRWDEVASRCLSCTNCTLACPTCFCGSVADVTDLSGETAERVRRWDSCFTLDHSFIHGGSVRASVRSRYRQWLTHKVASWIDQFGVSGCVGCGRCITWCPVGIDITEELAAIRASDGARRGTEAA